MSKESGFSFFKIHTESIQEAITHVEDQQRDCAEWLELKGCPCAQEIRASGEPDFTSCTCSPDERTDVQEVAMIMSGNEYSIQPQTALTLFGEKMSVRGRPTLPPTPAYELGKQRRNNRPVQLSRVGAKIDTVLRAWHMLPAISEPEPEYSVSVAGEGTETVLLDLSTQDPILSSPSSEEIIPSLLWMITEPNS